MKNNNIQQVQYNLSQQIERRRSLIVQDQIQVGKNHHEIKLESSKYMLNIRSH